MFWLGCRCIMRACRLGRLTRLFIALRDEATAFESALKALLVLADAIRVAAWFARETVARVGVGARPDVVASVLGVIGAEAFVAEAARTDRLVFIVIIRCRAAAGAGAAAPMTLVLRLQMSRRCGRRRGRRA